MAALVKLALSDWRPAHGSNYVGPVKVADADETDLSAGDTSIVFDVRGVEFISCHVIFANYTSVTVKLQESVDDGATYYDITNATTAATAKTISAHRNGPLDSTDKAGLLRGSKVRLSIAGTLSGSADTMTIWAYMEGK